MRDLARAGWAVFAVALCAAAPAAYAQTAANVLLVINQDSPASVEIGEYYAAKRALAPDHVLRLKVPVTDTIDRQAYLASIESPIAGAISRASLQDDILYIVLTKGMPIRIAGTADRDGTLASVDSELTLLYRKLTGAPTSIVGRVDNPYFLGERPLAEAKPFTRSASDIYLVTRLDGFTVEDVRALIDRGTSPEAGGVVVLDQRGTSVTQVGGDRWLEEASVRLLANGPDSVVLDSGRAAATTDRPVIGYYSWGSNDSSLQRRQTGLKFVPGAIGGMFVSTDGRTFSEPPADWTPAIPMGIGRPFAGTMESLAGDLVREGLTGVSASVAEPFLDATVRPQVLLPAYMAGHNLAESFYLATPFLSWRTLVIGDPLCRPFPGDAVTAETGRALDPDTELPSLFSARRLRNMSAGGLNPEALKLWLKVESRVSRGIPDVKPSLIEATRIEPRFTAAHERLGELYDTEGDYANALARYQQVIALDPKNPIALNNLAYVLSERLKRPGEALRYAEQAYDVAPDSRIADTLGWIHHLLGDDRKALPFVERAVADKPGADALVHAAEVYAALGNRGRALEMLAAAEAQGDQVAARSDVQALRTRLGGTPAATGEPSR